MVDKANVSIVICTMNRPDELQNCFESILGQTKQPYEIAVVDCSKNSKTADLVKFYRDKFLCPLLYIHTKPGLTSQRNVGVSMTKGELLMFLDDDVILKKNYIHEIVRTFKSNRKTLGVGGRIINFKSHKIIQNLFRFLFLMTSCYGYKGKMKRSGFANFQFNRNQNRIDNTEILSGCNCTYKRTVFEKENFDKFFDGYGLMEDIEFSYRISRKGSLLYNPMAELYHEVSPNERLRLKEFYLMEVINHHYLFNKIVKVKKCDWIFYWWSLMGLFIYVFMLSIKKLNADPVRGLLIGLVTFYNQNEQ